MTTTTAPAKTPRLTDRNMQCAGCGNYFSGLSNFDRHRAWHADDAADATNRRRICREPSEVGLHLRDDGLWGGEPMTDEQKAAAGWGRER